MKLKKMIWPVLFILYYSAVLLKSSSIWLSSDLAGTFLNAIVALREGRLIPYGFNYTSIAGFQSHLILMPILYRITNSVWVSFLLHNVILESLVMVSAYYLAKALGASNRAALLVLAFLALPFSNFLVDMHVVSQFYSLQFLCILVSLGVYFSIEKYTRLRLFLGVISVGILCFLQGLNGNRYLSFFFLPFLCTVVFQIYTERKNFSLKKLFVAISCTIGSVLGYLCFVFYIKKNYSTYDFSMATVNEYASPHSMFNELINSVYAYLDFFGGKFSGVELTSFDGLFQFTALLFAAFLILVLVYSYKNIRKNYKPCFYVVVFSLFSLLINNVLCLVLDETVFSARYDYLSLLPLFMCLILYIEKLGLRAFINKRFINFAFVLLFAIYTIFCQVSVIRLPSSNDQIACINSHNDFLIANNCHFAYASYWHANVSTVRSELNVEYAALNDVLLGEGKFAPWFGGMPREYYKDDYHEGVTAIVLTNQENAIAAANLPQQDHIINTYSNNMYVVYLYDVDPFNFEADLYQYAKLPSDG